MWRRRGGAGVRGTGDGAHLEEKTKARRQARGRRVLKTMQELDDGEDGWCRRRDASPSQSRRRARRGATRGSVPAATAPRRRAEGRRDDAPEHQPWRSRGTGLGRWKENGNKGVLPWNETRHSPGGGSVPLVGSGRTGSPGNRRRIAAAETSGKRREHQELPRSRPGSRRERRGRGGSIPSIRLVPRRPWRRRSGGSIGALRRGSEKRRDREVGMQRRMRDGEGVVEGEGSDGLGMGMKGEDRGRRQAMCGWVVVAALFLLWRERQRGHAWCVPPVRRRKEGAEQAKRGRRWAWPI